MLSLNGTWTGRWQSSQSKRGGPMRAVFVQAGSEVYHVQFVGWFLKVLPFWYTATLDVVDAAEESVRLTCSRHLGLWFGTFTMHAEATAQEFIAEYSALKDVGRFTLVRHSR